MLPRRSDRQAVRRHARLAVVWFQAQSSISVAFTYGFTTPTKQPPAPRPGAGGFSHTATPHFCINRGKSALRWRANGNSPGPAELPARLGWATRELRTLSLVATTLAYYGWITR